MSRGLSSIPPKNTCSIPPKPPKLVHMTLLGKKVSADIIKVRQEQTGFGWAVRAKIVSLKENMGDTDRWGVGREAI